MNLTQMAMKYYTYLLLLTLCLVSCKEKSAETTTITPTTKPTTNKDIVIGSIDSLYSNILDEPRNIRVHLPKSMRRLSSEKTKYPVLYVLDAKINFDAVIGMINQLNVSGVMIIPEMIVVGIDNTNRTRDLLPTHVDIDVRTGDSIPFASGGNDKFLNFIEEELIPHIEKKYPAASHRTFIGHSFGGLSVINALITKPHLFSNYVAIDPSLWWDDMNYLKTADSTLTHNTYKNKSLFVSVANHFEKGMPLEQIKNDTTAATAHMRSMLQFVTAMDKNNNGLDFKWNYYTQYNHSTVPAVSTYDALISLFGWYELSAINEIFDGHRKTDATAMTQLLTSHYTKVTERLGYEFLPPEILTEDLAYGFMYQGELETAADLFDLNLKNYPNSSIAHDSRGDCYLAQNDSIKALETFNKALTVGTNQYSQKKIDMLNERLKKNK